MTQFPNPNDPPTQPWGGQPQDLPANPYANAPNPYATPPPNPFAAAPNPYAVPPQQPVPPQSGPPQSGPPQSGPPQSGPPQSAPPVYGPPQSAPPVFGPPQSGPPQPGYGGYQPGYGYPQYAPPPKSKLPLVLGIIGGVVVLILVVGVIGALASRSASDKPSANGTNTPAPTSGNNTGGPATGGPATNPPGGGGNPNDLAVGQSVTVTDSDGTMTVTVNSVTYRTTGCDTGDFNISNPQPGDAYIVIETTYQVTKGQGSYNPFDWSVVDPDGNESRDPGLFADCKPELNSGNNLTGKRHGLVVIEVKAGVKHGQIVYAPGFGQASGTWKF